MFLALKVCSVLQAVSAVPFLKSSPIQLNPTGNAERRYLEKVFVTVHSLIFCYFFFFFSPLKIFVCKEHFTVLWGSSVHTAYSVLEIVINLTLVSFFLQTEPC